MHVSIKKELQRNSFWLSLIFHVLLLLYFLMSWKNHSLIKIEPSPSLFIPSYVSQSQLSINHSSMELQQQKEETARDGIEKKAVSLAERATAQQFAGVVDPKKWEDPVHLIGKQKMTKPLIKIIGQALTARLVYPKIAIDFRLKGIAYVGFVIHPNGQVTDVQLVKSSGTQVLDMAALK